MNRKNQLFVYRCIKDEPSKGFFGLGVIKYKRGDYISYSGKPVKDINDATANTHEEYNLDECHADKFFKQIACKLVPVKI